MCGSGGERGGKPTWLIYVECILSAGYEFILEKEVAMIEIDKPYKRIYRPVNSRLTNAGYSKQCVHKRQRILQVGL